MMSVDLSWLANSFREFHGYILAVLSVVLLFMCFIAAYIRYKFDNLNEKIWKLETKRGIFSKDNPLTKLFKAGNFLPLIPSPNPIL